MIQERYKQLKEETDVRKNLIALRQELKDRDALARWEKLQKEQGDILKKCLQMEDPKIRKNAALILGETHQQDAVGEIYRAYETEMQLFVKSSYLKALEHLDYLQLEEPLTKRLNELQQMTPKPEEEKHYREEIRQLQNLLHDLNGSEIHTFCGYGETLELLLTTYPDQQQVTAQEIPKEDRFEVVRPGVHILTTHLKQILKIRTYRECLILLKNCRNLSGTPEEIGEKIAASNLCSLLKKCHKEPGPFYFRLEVKGSMDLEMRSRFTKRMAAAIEKESNRFLLNSTSDYEVEIRLMNSGSKTFLAGIRLMTIPDTRFQYRKEVVAASIAPPLAALFMQLARPYLTEHAQVLDPFCGVATMLVERHRCLATRNMYAIDTFGEAVEKARRNTRAAGLQVHLIHRDFFDFTHEYLFDEIVTNLPGRGKDDTRQDLDQFYRLFLEKSEEVLKPGGRIVCYSGEVGCLKKQMRLHPNWKLRKEWEIRKKEGTSLLVLEKKV
ncbi:MAG: methyltransferase domain-containing protein [Lachnospiraceae bacterium]